jgi:hopanoid biosynthesis associated radical SAM protein HpnH|uniref:Adenosyl-hopene transferase HpnH n=1 Tax=Desulfobacca acetoxidans TaxID=60893 RepID=A0A7V6A3H5_9BACT
MRFPLSLSYDLTRYLLKQKILGIEKFPLVLMLEPSHQCNLACAGCGRIQEYRETLGDSLTLEQCLESVDECGAPVVTVTGGEPLLYPPVFDLVRELIHRRKHIYLCTNAILLEKSLPRLPRSKRLTLSVHVDGLAATHDRILGRSGLFDIAIRAIKAAKAQGFRVCTNTTIYKATDMQEIESLFALLTDIGVDGILVSPAYSFPGVAPEMFLSREEIMEKFTRLHQSKKKIRYFSTPLYLSFLRGERHYDCTPWANPTRNPQGWRAPCYQLLDIHYPTFKDLMEKTDWDRYGPENELRCAQCMMHSGFEPSVVRQMGGNLADLWTMLRWNLS